MSTIDIEFRPLPIDGYYISVNLHQLNLSKIWPCFQVTSLWNVFNVESVVPTGKQVPGTQGTQAMPCTHARRNWLLFSHEAESDYWITTEL